MKQAKICKDCGVIIDGIKVRGMACSKCGKLICYKCNMTYKCIDCYNDSRLEYYQNTNVVIQ